MFSAADHVLPPLGDKMPDGTIIGARGAYGLMSQKSPLNDWLFKGYEAANGVYPVQAAYRITQSILGLKAAVEKAMAENGGKKPSTDELVAAHDRPGMAIARRADPDEACRRPSGDPADRLQPHQIQSATRSGSIWSISSISPAECVNPPPGVKALDWIKGGMAGAKCN